MDTEKTFDDVREYFKEYAAINAVRVVRDKKTKKSTGCAYMELSTVDDAKNIAEKKTFKWDANEVTVTLK